MPASSNRGPRKTISYVCHVPGGLDALTAGAAIEPPLEAFDEIPSKSTVILADDAWLVFLDYNRCQTVEVVGGRIRFEARGFYVNKGKVKKVERAECPREVAVAATGVVGGTVLRSATSAGDAGDRADQDAIPG